MGRLYQRIIALFLGLLLCVVPASAQGEENGDSSDQEEIQEMLEEQYSAAGADELVDQAPQEAQDLYEQAQQEPLTPGDILTFSPSKLWNLCVTSLKDTIKQPLVSLLSILGVLLLCAFFQGISVERFPQWNLQHRVGAVHLGVYIGAYGGLHQPDRPGHPQLLHLPVGLCAGFYHGHSLRRPASDRRNLPSLFIGSL